MINSTPNYVLIESDGTKLYQVNQMGSKTPIGYTTESYEQLINIAEQYKKKLEDAGLIEKQLTPEEVQKKQNELMEKLISKFEGLENRMTDIEKELTND